MEDGEAEGGARLNPILFGLLIVGSIVEWGVIALSKIRQRRARRASVAERVAGELRSWNTDTDAPWDFRNESSVPNEEDS